MGIPFNVYLPRDLYLQAKELTIKKGIPISFLIREGLRLMIERWKEKELKELTK